MLGSSFGAIAGGLDAMAHGQVTNQEIARAVRAGARAGFDAGLMFGALGAIGGPVGAIGSLLLGTLYLGPGFYGVIEDLQAGDFEGADFRSRMTVVGAILNAYSLKGSLDSYYGSRVSLRPGLKSAPSSASDWLNVSAGGFSPLRVKIGRADRVAVVGRSMSAIRAYQSELASRGIAVETFDGPRIPTAAMDEWTRLTAGGKQLTPSEVMNTQLFRENVNWATKLNQEDYTVIDLGNPRNQSQSIFYDTETSQIFGQ
jgi:hypothetical protein